MWGNNVPPWLYITRTRALLISAWLMVGLPSWLIISLHSQSCR